MNRVPKDEAQARSLALVLELNKQSDRGVAIIGVAWIEEALLAAIQATVEMHKAAWSRLFGKTGPISTLSAKIDLARILAMTSDAIHSDLHTLREIRNEFAHSVLDKDNSSLSFGTARIKDKCLSLRCVKHENIADPRHAFIRACAILNSDFYLHVFFAAKGQEGGRVVVNGE